MKNNNLNSNNFKLLLEFITFELERTCTPLFVAVILLALTLSCPLRATLVYMPKSTFEVAQLILNSSFISPVLVFFSTVILSYSFARDIEQGLMMEELTNPLRRETLFIYKFLTSILLILILSLIPTLLSMWLLFASFYIFAVITIEFIEVTTLLIYISLSIVVGLTTRSSAPSIIIPLSFYFLEEMVLFSFGYSYGNTSPESIMLRLILTSEVTALTWVVLFIHVFLAFIVIVLAFFYFKDVMQFD